MTITHRQRTLKHTQNIKGDPQEIFPLLCPNRETEWLDGWKYVMIHSKSGYAEENCVFTTPMHGEQETYWVVSRYEPSEFIIEFVRFTIPDQIVKISIRVHEKVGEYTPVDIAYTYTALNQRQNGYIEKQLQDDFRNSMEWWEKSMNHFLEHGTKLLRNTEG